jgi:hypothetical protein
MHRTLELSTTGPGLTEITRDVAAVVSGQGDGLLTLAWFSTRRPHC